MEGIYPGMSRLKRSRQELASRPVDAMDRTVLTMSIGPYPSLPLGRSRGAPLSLARIRVP
jgi:hypothetical protein